MKSKYRGYFDYTEEEFDEIWSDCLFVFDACSILDLFRVSDKTRQAYFKALDVIKENIWIPDNIAKEFVRNKDTESNNYIKEFTGMLDEIKINGNFEQKINALKNRISGSEEEFNNLKKEIEKSNKNIEKTIEKIKSNNFKEHDSKKIENSILELFDGKIGDELGEEKLKTIYSEGEIRFKNKIPPGFKDEDKDVVNRKYGDLINWLCIINQSIKTKKNVIFITSEKKKDWFLKEEGKIKKPRQELLAEFNKKTGKLIYIYRIDSFIKYMKDRFQVGLINDIVVEELKSLPIKQYDLDEIMKSKSNEYIYKIKSPVIDRLPKNSILEYLKNNKEKHSKEVIDILLNDDSFEESFSSDYNFINLNKNNYNELVECIDKYKYYKSRLSESGLSNIRRHHIESKINELRVRIEELEYLHSIVERTQND